MNTFARRSTPALGLLFASLALLIPACDCAGTQLPPNVDAGDTGPVPDGGGRIDANSDANVDANRPDTNSDANVDANPPRDFDAMARPNEFVCDIGADEF